MSGLDTKHTLSEDERTELQNLSGLYIGQLSPSEVEIVYVGIKLGLVRRVYSALGIGPAKIEWVTTDAV